MSRSTRLLSRCHRGGCGCGAAGTPRRACTAPVWPRGSSTAAEPFAGSLDDWRLQVVPSRRRRAGPTTSRTTTASRSAGHDTVYRRFGHTVGRVAVLSDQWLWVVDGVGHQLLGTVAAAEDYEDYCDVFESVAETFDPHADRQSRSA